MMLFRDQLFDTYYSYYDKVSDTNKDVNGKGTWERINEVVGGDLDDNVIPLVSNLIPNVIMPATCFDRYVPFLESEAGYDAINNTLRLGPGLPMRRSVLAMLKRLYQIKGTIRCYEVLFGKLGMTIDFTEYNGEYGFDSPITLDDEVRRFDSFCPACSDYSLDIHGTTPLSNSLIAIFKSIITFCEPINARLRSITYNGDPLTGFVGDFNNDYNNDYLI